MITDQGSATEIIEISRDYLAPHVVHILPIKRATPTMDDFLVRSDGLRLKAEPKVQTVGVPIEVFATLLCMQNASLARPAKSLALTIVRGNFGISVVAQQMRRLFGPRVGAARQKRFGGDECGGAFE